MNRQFFGFRPLQHTKKMTTKYTFESSFNGNLADLIGDDEFNLDLTLLDEPADVADSDFLGRASFFGSKPPPAARRTEAPAFFMSPPKAKSNTKAHTRTRAAAKSTAPRFALAPGENSNFFKFSAPTSLFHRLRHNRWTIDFFGVYTSYLLTFMQLLSATQASLRPSPLSSVSQSDRCNLFFFFFFFFQI